MKTLISLLVVTFGASLALEIPKSLEGRIVGGERARAGQFPHQVGIFCDFYRRKQFCGGSLINNQTILTAAQCLHEATLCDVILGAQNIREKEDSQVDFIILSKAMVVHREYDPTDPLPENDIALINLPRAVEFTEFIQPIALPSRRDVEKNWESLSAISSGWGRESDDASEISEELNWIEGTVISNEKCNEAWGGLVKPSMVCLAGKEKQSICRGDAGGPTYVLEGGKKKLIGLADSTAGNNCETGNPHVHTRPEFFLDWLEENSSFQADP